jgi:hypothetical protein
VGVAEQIPADMEAAIRSINRIEGMAIIELMQ